MLSDRTARNFVRDVSSEWTLVQEDSSFELRIRDGNFVPLRARRVDIRGR